MYSPSPILSLYLNFQTDLNYRIANFKKFSFGHHLQVVQSFMFANQKIFILIRKFYSFILTRG